MKVAIIAAIASNRAIGKNNTLLWKLPEDMRFFRDTTLGHTIITGRKNYESIPPQFRPLKNRTNIVVTRKVDYSAPGALVVHSLQSALKEAARFEKETVYIIGGGEIYREAMEKNLVDELMITHVDAPFEADVFFPDIPPHVWEITSKKKYSADEKNAFNMEFVTYQRVFR